MEQCDGFRRTAFSDFIAVISAFLAGLLEAESIDEEALRFGNFADGENWAVEAARGDIATDFANAPSFARMNFWPKRS